MKVLWFTNVSLSFSESKGSGSWLFAMKDLIKDSVELYCISEGNVESTTFHEGNGVQEYIIPAHKGDAKLPPLSIIKSILSVIEKIDPDIIHIWGVEKYWIRLFEEGYCERKYILEIQGLLSSCAAVFWAGFTKIDRKKSVAIKEIIMPRLSLERQYISYIQRGENEKNIISKAKILSVQSEWTKNQLRFILNPSTRVFETLRPIRNEFYLSKKWTGGACENVTVFTSFSYSVPFKGLHILFKAIKCLVCRYPNIVLRIAGKDLYNTPVYLRNGYEVYLLKLIKELQLENHIVFLKSLNATSLIDELLSCDVFVNPSFVESYSAAAAEALYLGVPTVLSYAGALQNFSDKEKVALYYSPLDYTDCASKISLLIDDVSSAKKYSESAIRVLSQKCSDILVRQKQLSIYESVINE